METWHPKRPFYAHQQRAFDRIRDLDYHALFMEQRTGKTPIAINKVAYDAEHGHVDAAIVIAPNLLHREWVHTYWNLDWPDHAPPCCSLAWDSRRTSNKSYVRALELLLTARGFALLGINIESIITQSALEYLSRFLRQRKVFAIIDESLDIGTYSSKRARVAIRIGRQSKRRLILEGTPTARGPLMLFSQFEFLAPGLLGATRYTAFCNQYAVYDPTPRYNNANGRVYHYRVQARDEEGKLIYRNMDVLRERVARHSFRVTRDECADIPPKVHEKVLFELTKKQRNAYDTLRRELRLFLENDREIDTAHVLTRLLREQQIASNFLMPPLPPVLCPQCSGSDADCPVCLGTGLKEAAKRGSGDVVVIDDDNNPRLIALTNVLERLSDQQGIIWARFNYDIEVISAWARSMGISHGLLYGGEEGSDRIEGIERFMRGEAQLMIGNPHAGGRGIDLSRASFVVYYSNSWSLRARLQSEDRAQSLKKREPTLYIDLVADDTIDDKILDALRHGNDVAMTLLQGARHDL